MRRALRRTRAGGWILGAAAAVFLAIALAAALGVGRHGPDQLLHPVVLLLVAIPAAIGAGLALAARAHLRHRPVVLALDTGGIARGRAPKLARGDLAAVSPTTVHAGYGPRESLVLWRRAAGQPAGRLVPAACDLSAAALLGEIDAAPAGAGLCRQQPPRTRFRLLRTTRCWQRAAARG